MVYKVDDSLTNFKFWSGAATNVELLTYDELEQLDDILPEYFGENDIPTQTEVNDLFWFDFPTVVEALGYTYDEENGEIIRD